RRQRLQLPDQVVLRPRVGDLDLTGAERIAHRTGLPSPRVRGEALPDQPVELGLMRPVRPVRRERYCLLPGIDIGLVDLPRPAGDRDTLRRRPPSFYTRAVLLCCR